MSEFLRNFVLGLKKSFSGKDYLRDINQCDKCGKPSFFDSCLYCKTKEDYEKSNKDKFMGKYDSENGL